MVVSFVLLEILIPIPTEVHHPAVERIPEDRFRVRAEPDGLSGPGWKGRDGQKRRDNQFDGSFHHFTVAFTKGRSFQI